MVAEPTVFVVDDDPAMRESLVWLIESVGIAVETYGSARDFLRTYEVSRPGCLVLDVRMPGLSGLDLQDQLAARKVSLPVIIVTGYADVPMAVRALKAGAVDFIEKPFSDQQLLDRIQDAIEADALFREEEAERERVAGQMASLTPREEEVRGRVVDGKSNKVIASELGVSAKTVEAHRKRVMQKLRAGSLADLIRMGRVAGDNKGKP